MTTLPPWDPDEYDREVKASRERAKRENAISPPRPDAGQTTVTYRAGTPRGWLTEAEALRREAMDKALRRRPRRHAKPRRKSNGKWVAQVIHEGRQYTKTFDTYEEAEQFIEQVKEGGRP